MATNQNPQQNNMPATGNSVSSIPPQPPTAPSPYANDSAKGQVPPSNLPPLKAPTPPASKQPAQPPIPRQYPAGMPPIPITPKDTYREKVVSLSHFPQELANRETTPQPPSPPVPPALRTPKQAQNPIASPQGRVPVRPQMPQPQQPERLEQLRRGDIRTMEKDITRIREHASQAQLQQVAGSPQQRPMGAQSPKISPLPSFSTPTATPQKPFVNSAQTPIQKAVGIPPNQQAPAQPQQRQQFQQPLQRPSFKETLAASRPQAIIRDLPKPPSSFRQNLIRIFVVLIFGFILVNAALWGFWAFQGKGFPFLSLLAFLPLIGSKETATPSPSSDNSPSPPAFTQSQSPSASPIQPATLSPTPATESNLASRLAATLHIKQTVALQFEDRLDLQTTLARFTAEAKSAGFLRLLFQKQPEHTILSAQEFFATFHAVVPADVQAQWDVNEFYFLYTFTRGTRFGMIIPVADAGETLRAMRNWEPTLDRDTQNLSFLWGAKGAGYSSSFRSKAYLNNEIRFQTFSLNDTGIVYAVVDNYLVITSSYETAQAAMNAILEK